MKTSESLSFSDVFRKYRNIGLKQVNMKHDAKERIGKKSATCKTPNLIKDD